MVTKSLVLTVGAVLLAVSSPVSAAIVTVDAQSDIFEAGLGTPGTSVGANLGLYPALAAVFTAGPGKTISFNGITGTVKYGVGGSDPVVSPDGIANPFGNSATSITSTTGISGITFNGRVMFLVGVFLTDAAPTSGTQPASITFFSSGGGYDADNRVNWFDPSTTFSIDQTFYIGDGLTGFNNAAGTPQVWNVPSNATRLFLGFADGGSAGPFVGAWGAYNDNLGSLSVPVNIVGAAAVPEPGTIILLGLGLASVGLFRKNFIR